MQPDKRDYGDAVWQKSGHVYCMQAIEELNIKCKNWKVCRRPFSSCGLVQRLGCDEQTQSLLDEAKSTHESSFELRLCLCVRVLWVRNSFVIVLRPVWCYKRTMESLPSGIILKFTRKLVGNLLHGTPDSMFNKTAYRNYHVFACEDVISMYTPHVNIYRNSRI